MKGERCQNSFCQFGSCPAPCGVEAVHQPACGQMGGSARDRRSGREEENGRQESDAPHLEDAGDYARAGSLPEIASLVELASIGSITREKALLSADSERIGEILQEAEEYRSKPEEGTTPEMLLDWSDSMRSLRVYTEEAEREIQERLMNRWKGHLVNLLHSLQGAPLTVALVSGRLKDYRKLKGDAALDIDMLRDIQLEALFRAAQSCQMQRIDCSLELLVPYPEDGEAFHRIHDFIDRVGEETLCHQRRSLRYRVGAMLDWDVRETAAAEIARFADFIVINGKHEGAWLMEYLVSEEERGKVLSAGIPYSVLEELVYSIRRTKPAIRICLSGAVKPSDLAYVYRLGLNAVSTVPSELPGVRLAAAQWELLERQHELRRRSAQGRT
ncbi:putative PEP-binding protein [Paenibacillus sp. AR247]|uniref:putative PEP-binding protein n=1 Tax=Paenibacillus sp. AR247 TaxID=1631599 RepID=UPI0011B0ACAA|nr:putative PEP-binding protein [Paenibacillus sp. AR247]